MLLEIYLFLTTIGFISLVLSLSIKKKGYLPNFILALVCAITNGFLASASFDIEYVTCENQVIWMNQSASNENDTQITNQISCNTENYVLDSNSNYHLTLLILGAILTIVYALYMLFKSTDNSDQTIE